MKVAGLEAFLLMGTVALFKNKNKKKNQWNHTLYRRKYSAKSITTP